MKRIIIGTLLFGIFHPIFPCANAYIFKVFPVGIINDTIISIDVQIHRSDNFYILDDNGLPIEEEDGYLFWILRTYISKYDKQQQLFSSEMVDSVRFAKYEYKQELEKSYQLAFHKIDKQNLALFNCEYISFCGYQHSCELVALNEGKIVYRNQEYSLPILDVKNKYYFGFDQFYFPDYSSYDEDDDYLASEEGIEIYNNLINGFAISSVRKFSTQGYELIVSHLQRGHELAMNWITHDGNDPRLTDDESTENFAIYMYEYIPKDDIQYINHNILYEEPLLHHGYGFDLFIITPTF